MQNEKPLNNRYIDDSEDEINLRETFEQYSHYWKWFALSLLIALLGAYMYLRYTHKVYQVATTILVGDEKSGGMPSELSVFEDLGMLGSSKSSIENELGILKSRSLMERVVKDLDLNISYFENGSVMVSELFQEKSPILLTLFKKDSVLSNWTTRFLVIIKSDTQYEINNELSEKENKIPNGVYTFGEKITSPIGDFMITPTNSNLLEKDREITVNISTVKKTAKSYLGRIDINLLYKKSTLIELSLKDRVRDKAILVLNTMVKQYNKDAIEYKSLVARNTNDFISQRLTVIEKDLTSVDKGVETFKTTNKLTDLTSEASLALATNSEIEQKIIELTTQLKLVDYVIENIAMNPEGLIPANLGLQDGSISSGSTELNKLILERNRLLKSTKKENPIIVVIDGQIIELRSSVTQSLQNLRSSLSIALADAKSQEYRLNSKIRSVPKQEREYRNIQREQQIIETLYLFLLQKREENAISLAATVPNAKVIDPADGSENPVSPKTKIVYALAGAVGLAIPFVLLSLFLFLNNKVQTKKDIEEVVKAPFIGVIPKHKKSEKIVISKSNTSNIAESFRIIRNNLKFLLSKTEEQSKLIYVTSTIPNEGKTFVAINLTISLCLLNKKVLLIGADIRKPKLNDYLNLSNKKEGLTHYLMDKNMPISEIIETQKENNFDLIQAGVIPPNPSELLMNGRFEELLTFAHENYDYIIVDTSPVSVVADTIQFNHKDALFLYVVRANFLDKRLLEYPENLYRDNRISNMAMILNDVDTNKNFGYGYGYEYVKDSDKSRWWKGKS